MGKSYLVTMGGEAQGDNAWVKEGVYRDYTKEAFRLIDSSKPYFDGYILFDNDTIKNLPYYNEHKKEIIAKFSELIDLEEIRENDFNLNISRYIDISPEEEPVDVIKCLKEIRTIQRERKGLEEIFEKNIRELGYDN
jgi:type I restriction enzyme M protein